MKIMTLKLARLLPVSWSDRAWTPGISKHCYTSTAKSTFWVNQPGDNLSSVIYSKPMNQSRFSRATRGFTLIELLVVIAIIAILAGLLLPVLGHVKVTAKVAQAKTEMNGLIAAINQYETAYSRLPVSSNATYFIGLAPSFPDFTFGTVNGTNDINGTTSQTLFPVKYAGGTGTADNRDVIAILMALPFYPDGVTPTADAVNSKNPQKTPFLNAKLNGNTTSPGIGQDYVYRDPWGNPYIISMDLNYDNKTRDAFYCKQVVSSPGGTRAGLNGLNQSDTAVNDSYEANTSVMIWSFGPDGKADDTKAANLDVNKDNILSWAN